jgi:hypothetical protein
MIYFMGSAGGVAGTIFAADSSDAAATAVETDPLSSRSLRIIT